MQILTLILLILALVLLGCAAFGVGRPRVHLGWLGLACWALTALIGAFGTLH
jgi:hypothetical protein